MRVLLVGKFPPIQGGVSAQTFWATLDLAEAGHEVFVLTNAADVDSCFRARLDDDDQAYLCKIQASGRIAVHGLTSLVEHTFIPFSRSDESRLYGRGCALIRCCGPFDAVVGWYLHPYGWVASMLARRFDLPFVAIHAGSDLFRLSQHVDLAECIQQTLSAADNIVTSQRPVVIDRLLSLGAKREGLVFAKLARLPEVFSEAGRRRRRQRAGNASGSSKVLAYSKLGAEKGTFDAIRALGDSAFNDLDFEFRLLNLGKPTVLGDVGLSLAERPGLEARVRRSDPIAPWRIPALLAQNDLVLALERRFSIAEHGSSIPREALATGCCLVISRELADKQPYARSLHDSRAAIVVEDPADPSELATKLRAVIAEPGLRNEVASRGQFLSEAFERHLPKRNAYATAILEALACS